MVTYQSRRNRPKPSGMDTQRHREIAGTQKVAHMNTAEQAALQQASEGADALEHGKQSTNAGEDGAWRGRYEAEQARTKELEAQLGNAKWAQEKLLELQNKPKDEALFDDASIAELVDNFGEDGAKVFQKTLERMLSKIPKQSSIADAQKGADKAQEEATKAAGIAANAEFLGAFDSETRSRITNPNSELMKFAATLKTGYGRTAAKDIGEIIASRDKSEDALAYIESVKSQFAQGKQKPQTAIGGSQASNQLGSKTTPKNYDGGGSIEQFRKIS
jgi:hypothetical protein